MFETDLKDDASNDPGDGAGNQADDDLDGDGDDDGKPPKRTADNVRGELLRKFNDFTKQFNESQKAFEKRIADTIAAQLSKPLPKPEPKESLADLSLRELENMRDQVQKTGNPLLKAEFEKALMAKMVDEAVNGAMKQRNTADRTKELDKRTRERISEKWGHAGIFDEKTDFHRIANEKMIELQELGMLNPLAMVGAIEEAADELGIQAKDTNGRRAPGNVARGGSSAPAPGKDKKHDETNLEHAIQAMEKRRGKKFTPEQRKNMSEMYQGAAANKDLYLRG